MAPEDLEHLVPRVPRNHCVDPRRVHRRVNPPVLVEAGPQHAQRLALPEPHVKHRPDRHHDRQVGLPIMCKIDIATALMQTLPVTNSAVLQVVVLLESG